MFFAHRNDPGKSENVMTLRGLLWATEDSPRFLVSPPSQRERHYTLVPLRPEALTQASPQISSP